MRPEDIVKHTAFLRRLAHDLAGSGADADDLVQESWLAALRKPPLDRRGVRTWLSKVLRSQARDARRSQGRRQIRERAAAKPEVASCNRTIEREVALEALVRSLRALGPEAREVLFLRYFDRMTFADAATRLGVPLETVRTRHRRALADLRKRLDRDSGGRGQWAPALLGAGAPALAGGTSATTATTMGCLIMSTSSKVVFATAALLVICMGFWWATHGPTEKEEVGSLRTTSEESDLSEETSREGAGSKDGITTSRFKERQSEPVAKGNSDSDASHQGEDQRIPVIRGRFVNKSGEPQSPGYVAATDRITPAPRQRFGWQKVRIRDGGRFRMEVRYPVPDEGTYVIELQRLDDNGGWIEGTPRVFFDVTPYAEPIEHDAGDVVLGPGKLIVGGRVVDQDGLPLDDAEFAVMRLTRPGFWSGLNNTFTHRLGDGRFSLHCHRGADVPPGDLNLNVKHRLKVADDGVGESFKLGETGRTFVITLGGGIAGSIDLRDRPARTVWLSVSQGRRSVGSGVREDGTFEVAAFSPGLVDLVIMPRGTAPEPENALALIKGITIEAGELNREPRLQGIRLARTRSVTLTVQDSQGRSLAGVDVLGEKDGVLRRLCSTDNDGRAQIVRAQRVGKSFEALVLMAKGYRDRRLHSVTEDRVVKLQAGYAVKISAKGQAALGDIADRLRVRLLPVVARSRLPLQRRNAMYLKLDRAGAAALRVPLTGTFRVEWGIDRWGDGALIKWVRQSSPTFVVVEKEDGVQDFAVTVPVQAVRDRWNRDDK